MGLVQSGAQKSQAVPGPVVESTSAHGGHRE